jgi:hypothetical protein
MAKLAHYTTSSRIVEASWQLAITGVIPPVLEACRRTGRLVALDPGE